MTPLLLCVPLAQKEQGWLSLGPGPTTVLCPAPSRVHLSHVWASGSRGSWSVPLPPLLSFLLTALQGESPGIVPGHPQDFLSVWAWRDKRMMWLDQRCLQDAVTWQQRLTWWVSHCRPRPPWGWQRRVTLAAFSGATLPTSFCSQPPNPPLASVSH